MQFYQSFSFHTGFSIFSGGFIGVDVFFVISGFLITTILIENLHNDSFSIYNFYKKRARRILPAVYFLLIVTSNKLIDLVYVICQNYKLKARINQFLCL